MCQVPEFSLYTDVPVVYCARIVLAVNNLNEIPCCLKKQPGEEEEEAALAWWGGECDTRAYIYHSISDRHQTKHNTDTQSALRTSLMFDWNMLDISNCETLPLNSHNPPPPPLSSLVSPNNDYKQILIWWLVLKMPFRASRRGGHDRWRHWSQPDGVPRHPQTSSITYPVILDNFP